MSGGNIQLKGAAYAEGVILEWQAFGIDASGGFKVIKSLSSNPSYPGNDYVFINPGQYRYDWRIVDGNKWHFRVCRYAGGKCVLYSNEVEVQTYKSDTKDSKNTASGSLEGISLQYEKTSANSVKLRWEISGSTDKGFKIVWSENSGTYVSNKGWR